MKFKMLIIVFIFQFFISCEEKEIKINYLQQFSINEIYSYNLYADTLINMLNENNDYKIAVKRIKNRINDVDVIIRIINPFKIFANIKSKDLYLLRDSLYDLENIDYYSERENYFDKLFSYIPYDFNEKKGIKGYYLLEYYYILIKDDSVSIISQTYPLSTISYDFEVISFENKQLKNQILTEEFKLLSKESIIQTIDPFSHINNYQDLSYSVITIWTKDYADTKVIKNFVTYNYNSKISKKTNPGIYELTNILKKNYFRSSKVYFYF